MEIDEGGHAAAPLWQVTAAVIPHRRRDVKTLPAEVLKSPGEVGVFPIEKEVGIEDSRHDPGRLQGLPPVEAGRAARPEDFLFRGVPATGRLSRTAVEVTARRGAIDAGRVEPAGGREPRPFRPQKPPGGEADVGAAIQAPGQDRHKIRLQAAIGIERQDIAAGARPDAQIHRRGETDVLRQLQQTHALAANATHRLPGAVGRIVVHDEHLGSDTALRERGADGQRQVRLVVVGDDDDGDGNHSIFDFRF